MFGSLDDDDEYGLDCSGNEEPGKVQLQNKLTGNLPEATTKRWSFRTIAVKTHAPKDPYEKYQHTLNQLLFGSKIEERDDDEEANIKKLSFEDPEVESDPLAQFPSGSIMRAEVFQNKTSVHLPSFEFMHRGHLFLQITNDYMQTAVNAFSILLKGNLQDVLRLPAGYVLKSAKTIAMMKIAKEKLAATWAVVKGNNLPIEISSIVLEMYRPLFKYLNGKEMARLNLSDEKILTFIGTHSDLDRHQVGVVASKYIRLNDRWMEPKYLNMMNNILCGVPMTFMRKVPESTFLQLTHQLFYHIRACDPLQRRFYLAMMTKTQALGKSYSWSARDVSRLGLLLTEVEGPDLAAVNPEAMSGITAQVMLEIPAATLKHITEMQLRYIEQKPLNILAKKLRIHQDQEEIINNGQCSMNLTVSLAVLILLTQVIK
ncbi:uncharacterized protein LOC114355694 [Ostrinia furnacalis]|uniref:uncharacterized protein LOC114355694 n=1 Tax=Ostrinia furnacalis TaxID=93504 RepID=UPI00103D9259|nr:uncharacterized protein LOC114355694 [Ostrinia furnacalis]